MSDSGVPSALVDAPQTGVSMNNGAKTDHDEQQAVYDIMKATGNKWATDIPDVCRGRWHGIECMPDKNNVFHVVSLSFGALSDDTAFPICDPTSYNSLSGPIPPAINLDSLQALILNGNPIGSTIPATAFGRLNNLMVLILSDTDLHGPIPESISRLPNLRILHLDRNRLNGSIPTSFRNLNGLSELRLNDNELIGPIPFEKEMIWNMRRKLKLENNLGLCYDGRNGFGDDLGLLSDSGIDHCDMPKQGPTKMVQHVSTANEGEPVRASTSVANSAISYKGGLVQLLTFKFEL
ncbi:hypothetical protein L1987_22813 [Smallanthus sonchifolius]|uniref:Uncharacterized protein n=1 Tax=Smallanthus sonchifolius TaxID=185202 RepID=A0ACB9IFW1_9ASTR|nr:hypothetical protein L1987_22813 [Smallanthus sonchifolius]